MADNRKFFSYIDVDSPCGEIGNDKSPPTPPELKCRGISYNPKSRMIMIEVVGDDAAITKHIADWDVYVGQAARLEHDEKQGPKPTTLFDELKSNTVVTRR
jgi:hypothetical protein